MKYPNSKRGSAILVILFICNLCAVDAFGMIKALNTAATGMSAQEAEVNNISNNIANINTIGFKKSRTETEDLLYNTIQSPGARSTASTRYSVGVQVGSGTKISATRKEFTQGSSKITNNPFDLMINGDGFFAVILPNNEVRYTRDGAFNVDENGNMVNKRGYKLFPGLVIPPNVKSIHISTDGKVDCYFTNTPEATNLGTIPVFIFINPVGLQSMGENMYQITQSSGTPLQGIAGTENVGIIQQGALEASNVNIMNEMTNLIRAQRAYEMNSKVMGVADQMLQTVNNIR